MRAGPSLIRAARSMSSVAVPVTVPRHGGPRETGRRTRPPHTPSCERKEERAPCFPPLVAAAAGKQAHR